MTGRIRSQPEMQLHTHYDHQFRQMVTQMRVAGISFETPRDRSKRLLMSHLDDTQRDQFERQGSFTVKGSRTGNDYHVTSSDMFNVYCGRDRYCAVLAGGAPKFDSMLAQALTLKTDEDRFLRTANIQPPMGMSIFGDERRFLDFIPTVRVMSDRPVAALIIPDDLYADCRPVAVPRFLAILPEILKIALGAMATVAIIVSLCAGAAMLFK